MVKSSSKVPSGLLRPKISFEAFCLLRESKIEFGWLITILEPMKIGFNPRSLGHLLLYSDERLQFGNSF
jgi:hypothetical protein